MSLTYTSAPEAIGHWIDNEAQTGGGRSQPVRARQVGSQHLHARAAIGQRPQPVLPAGDGESRHTGSGQQFHHGLTDPAGRAGNQRGAERVLGFRCHPHRVLPRTDAPAVLLTWEVT